MACASLAENLPFVNHEHPKDYYNFTYAVNIAVLESHMSQPGKG
jgi:hypothetical protein